MATHSDGTTGHVLVDGGLPKCPECELVAATAKYAAVRTFESHWGLTVAMSTFERKHMKRIMAREQAALDSL